MACILKFPSFTHTLSFYNGKLLISETFLKDKVIPMQFLSLDALVIVGTEEISVPLQRTVNHLGEGAYVLEECLSSVYKVIAIPLTPPEDVFVCTPIIVQDSPQPSPANVIDLTSPYNAGVIKEAIHQSSMLITKPSRSLMEDLKSSSTRNTLTKITADIHLVRKVTEIPRTYNGDIIFEFPPTMGKVQAMYSMEHRYDPHLWTKPQTSNIAFAGVTRRSQCIGSLKCINELCPKNVNYGIPNTSHFRGSMLKAPAPGEVCNTKIGKMVCHFCSKNALCIESCECFVYYVMPSDETCSRLMIHRGTHSHNVCDGTSKSLIDRTKEMVNKVLGVDHMAGAKKVQMCVAKEIVSASLIRPDGEFDKICEQELYAVADEMGPLVQDSW